MPPEEGFFGAVGRIAGTFMEGAPDGPRFAWNAVAPWLNELTRSATTRWLPRLVHGVHCNVIFRDPRGVDIACPVASVADCAVCRKPCCLDHSFVSKSGEAICYPCVHEAYQVRAPKVPGQERQERQAPPPGQREPGRRRAAPREPAPGSPPQNPEEVARERGYAAARKVLGVKAKATWAEVHKAYLALLATHHPDKHPEHKKAAAHARFVEIRAAYDFLKQAYPEAK